MKIIVSREKLIFQKRLRCDHMVTLGINGLRQFLHYKRISAKLEPDIVEGSGLRYFVRNRELKDEVILFKLS